MTFEEQAALVRCLKGAASSILWILLLWDDPLTAVELQEATGYSDKPVSQALARLKALGLVEHHGRAQGWRVSRRNWGKVARWQWASGRGQSSGHNHSTGTESGPVAAEREEDSAVGTEESSASCAATKHKLSTVTEGEDAGGLSARSVAEVNSASAVENTASAVESSAVEEDSSMRGGAACERAAGVNSAATVNSSAVTVKSSAATVKCSVVMEVSCVSRSSLSGPDFASAERKSGVDRNISAFPAQKRWLSPEKIRIGRCRSGAERGRGAAEGQARVCARNKSTTCYYYCCYKHRSSKQVKRQAKTRAGARPPPRGFSRFAFADFGLGIGDFGFWATAVGWRKGGPRMNVLKGPFVHGQREGFVFEAGLSHRRHTRPNMAAAPGLNTPEWVLVCFFCFRRWFAATERLGRVGDGRKPIFQVFLALWENG